MMIMSFDGRKKEKQKSGTIELMKRAVEVMAMPFSLTDFFEWHCCGVCSEFIWGLSYGILSQYKLPNAFSWCISA